MRLRVIFFFMIYAHLSIAQIDTVKIYSCLASASTFDRVTEYKINGEVVTQEVYNKYTVNNLLPVRVVYKKIYDVDEVLLFEGLGLGHCWVGEYKEYHDNGNLALAGSFNYKGLDVDDIATAKDCGKQHGRWMMYSEEGFLEYAEDWSQGEKHGKIETYNRKGEVVYTEHWDNGDFVSQEPIDDVATIWRVRLSINGFAYDGLNSIQIDTISRVFPSVYFKNNNSECRDLSYAIELWRGKSQVAYRRFNSTRRMSSYNIATWLKRKKAKNGDRLVVSFIQICQFFEKAEYRSLTIPLHK